MKIKSIVTFFVVAGLGVALLKTFNWDVVALFNWFFNSVYNIIDKISNFFTDNWFFRQAVSV